MYSKECSNLGQVNPKRFLPASWGEVEKSFYPVELQIYTIDRRGLLKDVVARMSDSKINILAANQKIRAMIDVLNVVRIVKTSKAIKQMASKKESK